MIAVLADASLRALVIALGVRVMLAGCRLRSATVRHAAWTAVTVAMLLMPFRPDWLPALRLPAGVQPIVDATFNPPWTSTSLTPPSGSLASTPATAMSHAAPRLPAPALARRSAVETQAFSATAIALALYLAGVFVLLARLTIGWIGATVLARRSNPAGAFFASSQLRSPVTIGVLRPRIVLPDAWPSWPADKLAAVLAHEQAHIRRHDPLVAWLAHLNRCLFWFHPLAWWLERQLAADAERACDEIAMGRVDRPRRYAEILLELASEIHAHGGRVAITGVPMAGRQMLAEPIDAVLASARPRASRPQRIAIATGCALVIALVACRHQPAPLVEDQEFARVEAERKAVQEQFEAARRLDPQERQRLHATLAANHDDLVTLRTLLMHYAPDVSGKKQADAPRLIAARRQLILWLIEHRPQDMLVRSIEARIFATGRDWLPDPEGFDAAERHGWLTRQDPMCLQRYSSTGRGGSASTTSLAQSSSCSARFSVARSRTCPESWVGCTHKCSSARTPSRCSTSFGVSSVEDAHSAYANEVRKKLSQSSDAALLGAAGSDLIINAQRAKVDFDQRALGRSYVDRALTIDPNESQARFAIRSHDMRERHNRLYASVNGRPREEWPAIVQRQSVTDRLDWLPELAESEYMGSESMAHEKKDPAAVHAAVARSKQYAQDALALASETPGDPNAATAIYRAHVTLGLHALREGSRKLAVKYMLDAVNVPASESMSRDSSEILGLDTRLVNYLLKEGERESVITFLERSAQLRPISRERHLKSAEAIRKGVMPWSYQAAFARR
jgi:hypothetical protein